MSGCSVCVLNQNIISAACDRGFASQPRTMQKAATTSSRGFPAVFPSQPGGDHVVISHYLTHLLILVYVDDVVASKSYSASCIKRVYVFQFYQGFVSEQWLQQ